MGQPARECFPEIWFSSRLNFDDRYLHSCELVTSQITTAIANASELVAELTAMKRLHQLSTRLLHETELQPLLEEVLNATIALQSADFGNVQLYNPMTTPTKGILEINDELCRILGYERSELLQKTWPEITHPDDLAADVAQFNRIMAGEIDGYSMEKRRIRKDGRVTDSIVAAKCLRCADGSVDYFVGLVLDTTERKRAEEALHKAQVELSHVTRVTTLGELAASIAHEINQPLGAIVNNANVCFRLAAASGDQDDMCEALTDIVNDANRASTIIARIRAMTTRALLGKTSLQLRDVITDVLALARRELTERRIEVRTELPEDLPRVLGDRVQLQQVLLNLVMNGIEAMSGVVGERRVLTIGVQQDELDGRPAVRITVQDLGSGIEPENMEHIFESFYSTKPQGMGMGLRISRSIVEAHGGLWAAPNAGPGVTFFFALPANESIEFTPAT
jgi:PAS domain S-box-containing protein